MTENTVDFDVVLYYNRRTGGKPVEPSFEKIQTNNPDLNMDDLLDLFSNIRNKYKNDLSKCDDSETIITTDYVFITEDKLFLKKVKEFEKNDNFVEWSKSSKQLINQTIANLI